jgi:hypothetical protein
MPNEERGWGILNALTNKKFFLWYSKNIKISFYKYYYGELDVKIHT